MSGPPPRKKRPYRMTVRREAAEATRARIVDAIVALHEEVGPRHTTIKAIAERAGVERLTVYRHFPDEASLFRACSACWVASHPPPDPGTWQDERDPVRRTRQALDRLYTYYRANRGMLSQIFRDLPDIPILAEVTEPFLAYLAALADELARGWTPSGRRSAVQVILRHVVRFDTWKLMADAGWESEPTLDRVLAWVQAVAK